MRTGILVSDFDGTLTATDFYFLARERWWRGGRDPWQDYLDGQCSHFEALRRFFASIDAPEDEVAALLPGMGLDARAPALIRRLHAAGWEVVVASAGCAWYIERLLAGLPVTIHSNPGRLLPGRGLAMELPHGSPFLDPLTGIDKVAVVRDALRRSQRVVFAGDGRPDLGPALLVPPERRFARGWLAEELSRTGQGFTPLERWGDLEALLG